MEDFEKVNSYSKQTRKRLVMKSILGLSLIIVGIFVYSENMFPGTVNSFNRRGGYAEVITIYPAYTIPMFLIVPGGILINNGLRSYREIFELERYQHRYRRR